MGWNGMLKPKTFKKKKKRQKEEAITGPSVLSPRHNSTFQLPLQKVHQVDRGNQL